MNEKKKQIIKILRCLVISNPQEGMSIGKLLSDFANNEGMELPLFEHRSALEFLRASGEFFVEYVHGDAKVFAKMSSESTHISKFIAEQRNNVKSKNHRFAPNQRSFRVRENTKRFGQTPNNTQHQPQHWNAPSVTFSFDGLQKGNNVEQNFKNPPTTMAASISRPLAQTMHPLSPASYKNHEATPKQLQSTQDNHGEKPRKKPQTIEFSFEELRLQRTEKDGRKNLLAKEIDNNEVEYCKEHDSRTEHELPWEDEYWSLFVTCCVSTSEVWAKLFGKHSRLDTLAAAFQGELLKNKEIATVYNVGQICITLKCGFGYRVQLDNVDHSNKRILCFFIDEGNQKWVQMNEIYNCRSIFMKYPRQAIRFGLYESEDLPRKLLESTFLNRPVTGRIMTKKEDFILQNKSNVSKPVIQAVLYDSCNDDFTTSLHPKLIKQKHVEYSVPVLEALTLTPVIISHIDDHGDIFCQLQRNSLQHVNTSIQNFVRNGLTEPFLPSQLEKKVVTFSNDSLFVVLDEQTKKLYRAKVIDELMEGMRMSFIDYGQIKTIPLPKMCYVEPRHKEIHKIPPQAIRTKLSGLDKVPESLVSRLREQFSVNKNAYVKNMQSAVIPKVKLYFEAASFMVCVNDSFKLENERNQAMNTSLQNNLDVGSDEDLSARFNSVFVDSKNSSSICHTKIGTFEPPKVNSCFEIVIVQSETPSNFVIKPIKYISRWNEQMRALQGYCKETSGTVPLDMIKEDEPYACLKSNGCWYRAFIKCHRSKLFAFFCDIADIDKIDDIEKIKFLPAEYRIIPKLAITARLAGIKPTNNDWNMDDNIQFRRLTKGKQFEAIVVKIIGDETNQLDNSILEIKLMYKSHCISDLFVDSGRAVRV